MNRSSYNKEWRLAHPGFRSAWRKANAKRIRDYNKAWRADNVERQREYGKAWYAAHPDYHKSDGRRASVRDWRINNRARYLVGAKDATHRRRARIARVLSTLTPKEWEAVLEAAGRACVYCGSEERISMDHLVPISRGGPHTSENVAPACLPCNLSKGAKTVMEFLAEQGEK